MIRSSANSTPKIGLILLRAERFDSIVALPELADALQIDAQKITAKLSGHFDLVSTWVVDSDHSLRVAQQTVTKTEVDLFILAFQVWAEDAYLLPLARAIGDRPLVVWCYLPWRKLPAKLSFVDVLRSTGPAGTFQGLGTLHNLGVPYVFTQGAPDDPRVIHDMRIAARAAQTRRALRSARFGLLPAHNEQMQSTFVDEFRLLADLGPAVHYLSVGNLQRVVSGISDDDVYSIVNYLRDRYPIRGISESTLNHAVRVSQGLARLCEQRDLDVLAFDTTAPEIHVVFGLRPALYPVWLEQNGIHIGLEGDLGAVTALFVLQFLSGSPTFFLEIWGWDEADNTLIGGHSGPQNPVLARPGSVTVVRDHEYAQSDRMEGAQMQFVTRSGQVTLLHLRGTPHGWQAIVVGGECLDVEPRLEGFPHAVIRLDAPVDEFVRHVARVGSTQHWIMAYGDVLAEVKAFCEIAGVPLEVIE